MRLRKENIDKSIKELTSVELSLYSYITQRQDHAGLVQELSITAAHELIGHSRQGLYNALYSLEEKDFIIIRYTRNVDFDILVLNNSFDPVFIKENKEVKQYVNLNADIFNNGLFYTFNVHIKRFILKFLSFKGTLRLTVDTLKRYKVHQYMDILNHIFKIFPKSNGTLVLVKKPEFFESVNPVQHLHVLHMVNNHVRKWGIDYDFYDLKDIIRVISNNMDKPNRFKRALNKLKSNYKTLNGALFNTIFYSSEPVL